MPDVRYVIVSDLHFGAENSILTALVPGGAPVADPTRRSPVLSAFVDGLAELAQANEGGGRPTLVLAGDILELALAEDQVAAAVFEQFAELVVGPHGLFDDDIWFVPGNHDHHLWETAREQRYARQIRSLGSDDPVPAPWHATTLFPDSNDPAIPSELLTALVQRRCGEDGPRVRTVYPNLGIGGGSQRAVVVHHGHFIESMYVLMSNLNQLMFGRPLPGDVWRLEAENFAWIDFFWSSLGRSGDVGEEVNRLYDMLQSEAALQRLVLTLATAIAERSPGGRPRRWVTAKVMRGILDHLARRAGRLERHHPSAPLSANAQRGLHSYLAGPLLAQLSHEQPPVPATTLVFGHTHKPFEDHYQVPGFAAPVDLANTGGWVVDTVADSPYQGAAAVVVDEEFRVASLRLYNQRQGGGVAPVAVRPVTDPNGELTRRLGGLVDPEAGPWRALSAAAAEAVAERHQTLQSILDRVSSLGTGGDPGPGPTAT